MGESKRDDDGGDDVTDHLGTPWGHFIAGPLLVAFVLVSPYAHKAPLTLLLATSVVACLPLVLDALLVPRFRRGATPQGGLSVPGTIYFVAAAFGATLAYAIAMNEVGAGREFGATLGGLICSAIAMVGVAMCLQATAERRKLIAKAANATPHRHPPQDGEWGALDGKLQGTMHKVGHETALLSMGANLHAWGGGESRTVKETPFSNFPIELQLVTDCDVRVDVRLADAAWLTLVHLQQHLQSTSVGDDYVRADIIGPEHSVRVVGRVRDGRFIDDGPGSVVVVAAVRNVRHSIRVLRMRDQASLALAMLGMASLVGALVVFVLG